MTLKACEIWGIVGPNGCGKSTLLHALCNLHKPDQGNIFLNNERLETLHPKAVAKQLGILLQEYQPLFPQTVLDYCLGARFPHLGYFERVAKQDKMLVQIALEQVDLLKQQQRTIHELSGGEKRRLQIASLLVQAPTIYLLDEPTNHLDIHYQIKILNLFANLAQNQHATVMMVLHDLNLVQAFCNHVLLIFPEGKTLQGETAEVMTETNLSLLYQHPIYQAHHGMRRLWQAGT
ncbi:MAG: ABC transporter ATP-binding protein [Gammaproteobacteria bacterium]|nr:ABC transporter ATP-binding protein [Gammaproteobacteria bacterium]